MMKENNPYDVRIGDVWVENDPRHHRRLKVIGFKGADYAELENLANGRKSFAKLSRFNGRRGGYLRGKA
jgi:hypothetical protein